MSYPQESRPDGFTLQLQSQAEILRKEAAINRKIADADPLEVDETFQQFPYFNERPDIEGIRQALEQAVAKAQSFREWNFVYANAAIRDLSMLGAALIRFEKEPADCVPGFSEILQTLAVDVAAKIPRDSFIDYTSRNPADERQRTFTSLLEEKIFIDSLRRGMSSLDSCLTNLLTACTFPLTQRGFGDAMQEAATSFQVMIDAIVQVKRGVTPETFTHFIRPFFEPFRVGDKPFSAPSGAEMPILNIDQIIWGAGCVDELYITYFNANIVRLPEVYQEISQTFAQQKSLMAVLKERQASAIPLNIEERRSIQELHHLLTRIYTFRMPHYKVAADNAMLRQRESGGTQEVKGSGGFGLVETKYVLDQTIVCRQLAAQALAEQVASGS